MSDWIPIQPDEVKTAPVRKPANIEINLSLSPYDVPEAVRGYCMERKKFVIEFKYINDEPTRVERTDEFLVRVGRHTGRLYEIEVDADRLGARSVTLKTLPEQIDSAIESLARRHEGRRDNYNVAKEVLAERRDQLFQELAAVS